MYTDATPAVRSTIVQSLWDQDMGQRGYKSSLPMPQALPGPMGADIAELVNLSELNLGTNRLEGTIPMELGAMVCLRQLNLCNNHLTGALPLGLNAFYASKMRPLRPAGTSLEVRASSWKKLSAFAAAMSMAASRACHSSNAKSYFFCS